MKLKSLAIICLVTILVTSCSVNEILKTAGVIKPVVQYKNVSISGLSFDKIDLLFDFSVNNPNSIGIKLAGFDYDVNINNNSFVSGVQDKGLSIGARKESIIQVPVTLSFKELVGTYNTLKDKDSTDYKLSGSFVFDLPVLGNIKVPYSMAGTLPVIKIPSISVESLKLNNINLMGANVVLKLNCTNPNAFDLGLSGFDYKFGVAGKEWVNSKYNQAVNLKMGKSSVIEIPIDLNFLQAGSSVYQLLTGKSKLDYFLDGNMLLNTSLPLLGKQNISINKSGQINLLK